jgi:hypothetical protein
MTPSAGVALKGTKISSSSFLINDHMHAANNSKPCPPWERRERREGEAREEKGERNRDFNALLIRFSSCFQIKG